MSTTRLVTTYRSNRTKRLAKSLLFVLLLALSGLNVAAQIAVTVSITDIDIEPSAVGQPYYVSFEVRVTGSNPSSLSPYGTVTVDDGDGNVCTKTVSSGDYHNGWASGCTLTSYTVGTLTLTASFVSSDGNFADASGTAPHEVIPATAVKVFVSDTPLIVNDTATGTVSVYGVPENYSTPPTGTVHLSHTGNGTLTPSTYALTAADAGEFEFTYTPADDSTTPHVITATYDGDGVYGAGSDTFDQAIAERDADIGMRLSTSTAYINEAVTVSVHVEDDTTAGTPGSLDGQAVTLTTDGTGAFSNATPTLDANGDCSVTYTPGAFEAGVTTLTATFGTSSTVYSESSTTELLAVELRPTQVIVNGCTDTILVNQGCSYTVSVNDVAETGTATSPLGTLTYSSYLGGDATQVPALGAAPSGAFLYTCTGLDGDAGIDTIYADYAPTDGIHAASQGYFGQGVQRRPTVTEVTGVSTPTGVTYTTTVREDPSNAGFPTLLQGDIHLLSPDRTPCSGLVGAVLTCADSFDTTSPLVNVTVQFKPTDRTHLASTGSANVERYDQFPDDPGDGTTGANCDDGCGSGGKDIAQMIFDLNASEVAMEAVKLGLDTTALVLDVIPDGVITGGLLVQTGVTIPYSDIAKAIVEGAGILLDIAILSMDTDLDDDGLPDILEENVTGTDYTKWDTDGDGLGDLDEIEEAGGYYGGSRRPDPNNPDSDGDGLSDGDEAGIYNTYFCVADTDCDTLSDGVEVGTWALPEIRDHSDPLMQDTDGDGLRDDLEIDAGCPYVNDADSDDDGLQDGYEDTNRDGVFDIDSIGDTGTTGSGETNFCDPDTDGDGLLDGEEEGLLGQGAVTASTPSGIVTTEPALDTDSDDDGLSDGEEVNVTHTDPLNWDTDGDSLSDLNELMPTGGTWPQRSFMQVSDPLDPDTDDDGLPDAVEYSGTGMGTSHASTGGHDDLDCPYVNDDDSDNDGLQDGAEDANHDGVWSGITLGSFDSQAQRSGEYWETDPCNPDTDGDGLLDGEEATLLGGGPISARPATGWPGAETPPGFNTVTPEGRSLVGPVGPDYSEGAHPLYTFVPTPGPALPETVPALDVDSDNDGLSDYEEVNITGTDPLDADSDNDTLADADELIATGGVPGATPQRTFDQESDPLDINTDDDYLFDPIEGSCGDAAFAGTGLSTLAGALGGARDTDCPYVNNADSDDDGVMDGAVIPIVREGPGMSYSYTFFEALLDVPAADIQPPGTIRVVVTPATGEQNDDLICNVCDPDSDGDGLTDGEEIGLGTDPQDWDTDDDGRSDWHEVTGGGPIPTDPFDPDTDDDGLLDSAEVFGSNPTNPVVADTDGDGLCDGGAGTPYMVSGHPTVTVNPICKSCSTPGLTDCGTGTVRAGSPDGIGDHPNRLGLGEDQNGNGTWDSGETDPNQYDTDGDGIADGIERLAYSTSRQSMIPTTDLFGRPITVTYPEANNTQVDCGCLDPLNSDTDNDGLSDGYEDRNHDGNFDFLPSEFDHQDPLPGPPIPYPTETNPCDADTDHDGLTDFEERMQTQPLATHPALPVDNDGDGSVDEDPIDGIDNDYDGLIDEDPSEGPIELTFNPTNPLDHDTDNDWLLDGEEVYWVCSSITCTQLDNDIDGLINEDWIDGLDNDGDGRIDEDPVDFIVRSIPMLDPTNRDSDSDGFIDGLDDDPCNSDCIPVLAEVSTFPVDTDGDGFSDDDEVAAATDPYDPESHPIAFCSVDLDFDSEIDDAIWLEPVVCCGLANAAVIDLDWDLLVDARVRIVEPRDVSRGDYDGDGQEDDLRYTIVYTLSNYRLTQPRVTATIDDYDSDLIIDRVVVVQQK